MAIKKTIKPYKILTEWKIGNNPIQEGDRTIVQLCLGECVQGRNLSYVVELIYEDILEGIQTNRNDYKITVNLGKKPQLIIFMNDGLVMHNKEVFFQFQEVRNLVKTIDQSLVRKAMLELRLNKDNMRSLSATTEALIATVNSVHNTQYPAAFIYAALNSEYEKENLSTTSEAQELLLSLEYKELIECIGAIHQYEVVQETENEVLQEVLQTGHTIEETKSFLEKMIYHKLYLGYYGKHK